jgi:hypothetical protein
VRLKVGAFARRRSATKALSVDPHGFGVVFAGKAFLLILLDRNT